MPHPRKATRKIEKYWITYFEIFKLNKKTLQNTARIKTKLPVQEELKIVTIDPDKVFPDYQSENNNWTSGK
jgi:hypothetical protein